VPTEGSRVLIFPKLETSRPRFFRLGLACAVKNELGASTPERHGNDHAATTATLPIFINKRHQLAMDEATQMSAYSLRAAKLQIMVV
jgi:hypothetical protein